MVNEKPLLDPESIAKNMEEMASYCRRHPEIDNQFAERLELLAKQLREATSKTKQARQISHRDTTGSGAA
jgi:hypothetical protein